MISCFRCFGCNRKPFICFFIGFSMLFLISVDYNFRFHEQCFRITSPEGKNADLRTETLLCNSSDGITWHVQECNGYPKRRVKEVSCTSIMEGDILEIRKATAYVNQKSRPIMSDRIIGDLASNCDTFLETMGYNELKYRPISEEEANFPIAYSIVIHKDVAQVERLLRNIYQPQNIYCLHVDAKSSAQTVRAILAVVGCFSNVFATGKREAIVYGHFTRLKADLNCMEDLVKRSSTWKYVINLTGQMFPLKTNREIVKILQTLRGTNDIEGMSRGVFGKLGIRFETKFRIVNNRMAKTRENKTAPPHDINLVKGSAFGSFSREFVEFVIVDGIVRDFLDWSMDVYSPDEIFWASLNSRWINPMFKSPGKRGMKQIPGDPRRPCMELFLPS